jgi:Flp pilus assembly pilin Flp
MKSNRLNREAGQGLVEYSLVLVMVAIVVIATMRILGLQIDHTLDQVEQALNSPANRGESTEAQASLQELRAEVSEMNAAYENAEQSLREIVIAAGDYLRESGAGTEAADQLAAFLDAVSALELDTALAIAENVDLTAISPPEWQAFMDGQAARLSRSCQYLNEAGTSPELYQFYFDARAAFDELPDPGQATKYLDEALGRIEQREETRLVLKESDVLAICEF